MKAKIEGLAALERRFKAIPERARAALAQTMEASAQQVVDMAKRLVEVKSGDLKNSIGWTWGDAPKGAMVIGTVKARGSINIKSYGTMRITIYAGSQQVFYARFVEYGTRPHSLSEGAALPREGRRGKLQGTGPQHPGATARPFFFPAYRANRKSVKAKMSAAFRKAIRADATS